MGDFAETRDPLANGIQPEEVKIPMDIPTCKSNHFQWLSKTVDQMNEDKEGIRLCWEKTFLLKAWDRKVQAEAARKVNELFPNLEGGANVTDTDTISRLLDIADEEDAEAGDMGVPFTQAENEDEWNEWLDWDAMEEQGLF